MKVQCRKIQVAKRLQQEQEDKDLLILLGDIPAHKASCKNTCCKCEKKTFICFLQEVEDLISATGQASLTGKAYLQGGRYRHHQKEKSEKVPAK